MEMLIGGYTLDELKKVQTAVRKDASAVISDAIDKATKALEEILKYEDIDDDIDMNELQTEINFFAKMAEENLKLAKVVSDISGVEYYLPYSSDYGSDGFYYRLESTDLYNIDSVSDAMSVLEDMEYQSRQWNQSNC
jgi:hypothetical protein